MRLIETSGRSIQQIANDLGISKSTLSRWRSEHEHSDLLEGPHEDVTKELVQQRKENEILRQEREILKKAAAKEVESDESDVIQGWRRGRQCGQARTGLTLD